MTKEVTIPGLRDKFNPVVDTHRITGFQMKYRRGYVVTSINLGDNTVSAFATLSEVIDNLPKYPFKIRRGVPPVTITTEEGEHIFRGNYNKFLESEHHTPGSYS